MIFFLFFSHLTLLPFPKALSPHISSPKSPQSQGCPLPLSPSSSSHVNCIISISLHHIHYHKFPAHIFIYFFLLQLPSASSSLLLLLELLRRASLAPSYLLLVLHTSVRTINNATINSFLLPWLKHHHLRLNLSTPPPLAVCLLSCCPI